MAKDKVLVSSAMLRRAATEDERPVRELGQQELAPSCATGLGPLHHRCGPELRSDHPAARRPPGCGPDQRAVGIALGADQQLSKDKNEYLLPALAVLSGWTRTYLVDLPGSGSTTRRLDVPGYAAAVTAWLDAAGLPPVMLIGHSSSTQVVAHVAATRPHRWPRWDPPQTGISSLIA